MVVLPTSQNSRTATGGAPRWDVHGRSPCSWHLAPRELGPDINQTRKHAPAGQFGEKTPWRQPPASRRSLSSAMPGRLLPLSALQSPKGTSPWVSPLLGRSLRPFRAGLASAPGAPAPGASFNRRVAPPSVLTRTCRRHWRTPMMRVWARQHGRVCWARRWAGRARGELEAGPAAPGRHGAVRQWVSSGECSAAEAARSAALSGGAAQ